MLSTFQKKGITFTLSGAKLRAHGKLSDADRKLIRTHKAEIMTALSPDSPPSCYGCIRLEHIEIAGEHVAGCVRTLETGPWKQEWKRIPVDLAAERSCSP